MESVAKFKPVLIAGMFNQPTVASRSPLKQYCRSIWRTGLRKTSRFSNRGRERDARSRMGGESSVRGVKGAETLNRTVWWRELGL